MAMIHVDDVFVSESGDFADFVLRLDAPALQAITVQAVTADRDASRFSDYAFTSTTVGFAVGESQKTVRVPITRDTAVEGTEAFSLNLTGATNASLARTQATAFIRDNDSPVGVPTISVTDVTVDERDQRAVFAITLDRPAAVPVSVAYATGDITTAAGSDYVGTSGSLGFAPGQTLLTVSVPLLDDTEAEPVEAFALRLSGASGGVLGRNTGYATIAASDATPQSNPLVSVTGRTVGESDGFAEFVVSLAAPTDRVVSVTAATLDVVASRFSDYLFTSTVLSFDPGDTTRVLRVPLTNDTDVERAEVFAMRLSSPTNAVVGGDAYAIVHDNDANTGNPVISVHDSVVDERDGFARVVVSLDRPGATAVSVDIATGSGTALSELDYAGTEATLVFAPGQTVQTFLVPLIDDLAAEQDETFGVTLTAPSSGSLGRVQGTVLIGRSDLAPLPTPTVSIRSLSASEADAQVPVVVQLGAPSAQRVGVTVTTGDLSASRFSDYVFLSDSIVFEPGQTTLVVPLSVTNDNTDEGTELLQLSMPTITGAVAGAIGQVTLRDEDVAGPVGMGIGDVVVNESEGVAIVPVWLTTPAASLVTVDYALVGASAVLGADAAPGSGQLRFVAGQTVQNLVLPITDDVVPEPDEIFNIQLNNPSGASLIDANGTVRISRNDMTATARPTVSIETFAAGEGDGFAEVVVQIDRPVSVRGTVTATTADGTASRFSDYTFVSSVLSFDGGDTVRVLRIPYTQDTASEGTETLRMSLSSPTNLVLSASAASATGTIVDDDNGAAQSQFVFGTAQADRRETSANTFFFVEVERLGDVSQPAFVNYTVASSSASGADFGVANLPVGQVSFAAGETARLIGLTVAGDTALERHEDFSVNLGGGFGGVVGQASQAGRIQNDDIAARNGAPQLGKDGSFLFDAAYYLWANPELVPTVSVDSAASNYLGAGAAQGRAPNSWFDATYYKNRWPDLTPLNLDNATLFQHFNLFGVWEGRSPGPKFQAFDGNRYLTDNPDVAAYVDAFVADFLGSRTNGAIAHYIIYGANEQRVAFDTSGAAITLDYLFGY